MIVVASLIGKAIGANPHIWYDPATMPAVAKRLAAMLAEDDPAHTALYQRKLEGFERSLLPLTEAIASLRAKVASQSVTATEPVARRMLNIAHESGIPVVGAVETEPPGKTYQAWMIGEVEGLTRALTGKATP